MKYIYILLFFTLVSNSCIFYKKDLQNNNYSGFSPVPENIKYDQLSISNDIAYFELISVEHSDTNILYRSGEIDKQEQAILKEARKKTGNGFGTTCPPGWCYYYFAALTKSETPVIVNSYEDLSRLVPEVITDQDVMFYIQNLKTGSSTKVPAPGSKLEGEIKKTKEGYLVLINTTIQDCPITYADILYKVTSKGEVTKMNEKVTKETNECI